MKNKSIIPLMVKRDVFRLLEAAPISEEMSHNGIAAERAFVNRACCRVLLCFERLRTRTARGIKSRVRSCEVLLFSQESDVAKIQLSCGIIVWCSLGFLSVGLCGLRKFTSRVRVSYNRQQQNLS